LVAVVWLSWKIWLETKKEDGFALVETPTDFVTSSYRIMLFATYMVMFLGSTVYHTFMANCKTNKGYEQLLLFDLVAAIGGMTMASHSFIIFGYRCWRWLPTVCWVAFFCFAAITIWRAVQSTSVKERGRCMLWFCLVRAGLGVFFFLPRIASLGLTRAFYYHFLSFIFVVIGGIINVSRFPECCFPRLRVVFSWTIHSHGWWHLFALLSAYAGYLGNVADVNDYYVTTCHGF